MFPDIVSKLLASFSGFKHNQVGGCVMHLSLGLQNTAGRIMYHQCVVCFHLWRTMKLIGIKSITVGAKDNAQYALFEGGMSHAELERFTRFAEAVMCESPFF